MLSQILGESKIIYQIKKKPQNQYMAVIPLQHFVIYELIESSVLDEDKSF